MAVYAAQIDRMDQGIGRCSTQLKAMGGSTNTLILFLADNGGCAEIIDQRQDRASPPAGADSFLSYGVGWANASNTPFRRYKHWVHEGGISTPLIAHWPAGHQGAGDLTHQPGHLIDLMATCLDLAGAEYPTKYKGKHDHAAGGQEPGCRSSRASRGRRTRRSTGSTRATGRCGMGKWKLCRRHRRAVGAVRPRGRPHRDERPGEEARRPGEGDGGEVPGVGEEGGCCRLGQPDETAEEEVTIRCHLSVIGKLGRLPSRITCRVMRSPTR